MVLYFIPLVKDMNLFKLTRVQIWPVLSAQLEWEFQAFAEAYIVSFELASMQQAPY